MWLLGFGSLWPSPTSSSSNNTEVSKLGSRGVSHAKSRARAFKMRLHLKIIARWQGVKWIYLISDRYNRITRQLKVRWSLGGETRTLKSIVTIYSTLLPHVYCIPGDAKGVNAYQRKSEVKRFFLFLSHFFFSLPLFSTNSLRVRRQCNIGAWKSCLEESESNFYRSTNGGHEEAVIKNSPPFILVSLIQYFE